MDVLKVLEHSVVCWPGPFNHIVYLHSLWKICGWIPRNLIWFLFLFMTLLFQNSVLHNHSQNVTLSSSNWFNEDFNWNYVALEEITIFITLIIFSFFFFLYSPTWFYSVLQIWHFSVHITHLFCPICFFTYSLVVWVVTNLLNIPWICNVDFLFHYIHVNIKYNSI